MAVRELAEEELRPIRVITKNHEVIEIDLRRSVGSQFQPKASASAQCLSKVCALLDRSDLDGYPGDWKQSLTQEVSEEGLKFHRE